MLADDSDSSGEETDSFTATNVLLGYASKEPTDDEFSRLGGLPVRRRSFIGGQSFTEVS